ncbi:MAG: urea carboxylase-associated family protein [Gammaproteobacteria bacterium]|jgi:uncharacterized protein|nr:urea carboxylase-associated family protein [Gammaproteobacteria bacterium]
MTNTTIDIPGYEGRATRLEKNNTFRVIDMEGCQIADMFVISAEDNSEFFSPALTKQVIFRTVAKPGDYIYSNRRRPMLTFLNDTSPGPHDMSFAPCDPGFYIDLGGDASHPNCRDNFYKAIGELDITIEPPPDPFNLFQNTVPKANGDFEVGKTLSKAGDYVEFRAEMDVIIVITACSVDLPVEGIDALGGKSTPLRIQKV